MSDEIIIGVDEVGRGCIAGDLLVCAYAIRLDATASEISELKKVAMDSKSFSSRKKREAVLPIIENAGLFRYARRNPLQIDASNIRLATLDAMREAANGVRTLLKGAAGSRVIVDGRDVPQGITSPVEALIKGDTKIVEISCASVLAKVRRDIEMEEAGRLYPGYGFEKHAGYGTQEHRDAIGRQGLCDIHRSWAEKFSVQP